MKAKLFLAGIAALAIQATAMAQGGPPPGGGFGGPGGPGGPGGGQNEISLLGRQDVQDDLALTADQKTKVEALVKKYQPQRGRGGQGGPGGGGPPQGGFGGGQGGPPGGGGQGGPPGGGDFDPEAMRAQIEKRQAEQKKAIAAVLTEAQIKRLGEIKVQMAGSSAVMDPEIGKKIDLTEDQRDRIQVMMEDERENMPRPDFNSGERPDPKQMQEQMKKMQAKINSGIDAILTASQKAKLKELGGKAFKRVDPQPGQRPQGGGGF